MHGRAAPTAIAAVLALLALGGDAGAQPAAGTGTATMVLGGLDPLQLKGSGFKRRERVRVTVTPTGQAEHTKRLRAKRNGSFLTTFRGVDPCNGIEAEAVGRRGSRASFQFASVGCTGP